MKIFLSYSALLVALANGLVSQEDLDQGLYFFGCTRGHAFNPGEAGEGDERESLGKAGMQAHRRLLDAVVAAEAQGRCRWHRPDSKTRLEPYAELNRLLDENGQATLPTASDASGQVDMGHYGLPNVEALLLQHTPGVQPFWRL